MLSETEGIRFQCRCWLFRWDGLNSEQQNRRISKGGFALLSLLCIIAGTHSLDIRPARNALELVRGKFNNFIHNSMFTLTKRTMHGRRVFMIRYSLFYRFCRNEVSLNYQRACCPEGATFSERSLGKITEQSHLLR